LLSEEALMASLGIPTGFSTSKLQPRGAAESMSGARIKPTRKPRQYMNIKHSNNKAAPADS
jgi:hypothetical protein